MARWNWQNKASLPAGRVLVTAQPESGERRAAEFLSMFQRIWAAREAAGLVLRSREEIDAQIGEFPAERLCEDCRQAREAFTKPAISVSTCFE